MYYWYDSISNSFYTSNEKNLSYIPQVVWVITDKCNYHCPFCFQPKTNTEINAEKLDSYIALFHKLGVQKIDISGGEPLFFRSIDYLTETLKKNGFHLTISTNGSGSDKNRDWIARNYDLFSRILVSVDGATRDDVDSICGKIGAFDRLMEFLDLLKKQGCQNLRINTVITSRFLDDDHLQKLFETIKGIQPCEWCLIQPHPENKLPSFDACNILTSEFFEILEKAEREFVNTNIKLISRSVSNYAGYWVINPDDTIILHTDGNRDQIQVDLCEDSVTEIISISEKYGLWVPTSID